MPTKGPCLDLPLSGSGSGGARLDSGSPGLPWLLSGSRGRRASLSGLPDSVIDVVVMAVVVVLTATATARRPGADLSLSGGRERLVTVSEGLDVAAVQQLPSVSASAGRVLECVGPLSAELGFSPRLLLVRSGGLLLPSLPHMPHLGLAQLPQLQLQLHGGLGLGLGLLERLQLLLLALLLLVVLRPLLEEMVHMLLPTLSHDVGDVDLLLLLLVLTVVMAAVRVVMPMASTMPSVIVIVIVTAITTMTAIMTVTVAVMMVMVHAMTVVMTVMATAVVDTGGGHGLPTGFTSF